MARRPIEEQLAEEIAEELVTCEDMADAIRDFARDWISDEELIDRAKAFRAAARERAERTILGPSEPDDCLAREGTWERKRRFA